MVSLLTLALVAVMAWRLPVASGRDRIAGGLFVAMAACMALTQDTGGPDGPSDGLALIAIIGVGLAILSIALGHPWHR